MASQSFERSQSEYFLAILGESSYEAFIIETVGHALRSGAFLPISQQSPLLAYPYLRLEMLPHIVCFSFK